MIWLMLYSDGTRIICVIYSAHVSRAGSVLYTQILHSLSQRTAGEELDHLVHIDR